VKPTAADGSAGFGRTGSARSPVGLGATAPTSIFRFGVQPKSEKSRRVYTAALLANM